MRKKILTHALSHVCHFDLIIVQDVVYDPSGKDFNLGDYMCFDDQICNVVQSFLEGQGGRPPTNVQLDRLCSSCQASYDCERANYKDSGSMIISGGPKGTIIVPRPILILSNDLLYQYWQSCRMYAASSNTGVVL